VQSLDIRLPREAMTMGRTAEGKPQPFSMLFAMVDSQHQWAETDEQNNLMALERARIRLVELKVMELEPKSAAAGADIVLIGEGFGPRPGEVRLEVSGLKLRADIQVWRNVGTRVRLPNLLLAGPVQARLLVVRQDGQTAEPLNVRINPQGSAHQ
jgi:hypothetical protein